MPRVINVSVNGEFISKDNSVGGVQGEGNTTNLHLAFDTSWEGYGKRIIWRNAQGEDPVAVILTHSPDEMLEPDYNALEYDTPIPTEPLKLAGWCTFTIEGYKDDDIKAVALTVSDSLKVIFNDSFYTPGEPTPGQAAQIMAEIAKIEPQIEAYAKEAKSWAVGGTGTREGEDTDNSKYYAEQAHQSAENAETSASNSADSASESANSAAKAKDSEESAAQSVLDAKKEVQNAKNEVQNAAEQAKLSESWAVGGTGARAGEDNNNAKYWASVATGAAGGGVVAFNGRAGAVVPEEGDYTPDMVGAARIGPDGKVPRSQLPDDLLSVYPFQVYYNGGGN